MQLVPLEWKLNKGKPPSGFRKKSMSVLVNDFSGSMYLVTNQDEYHRDDWKVTDYGYNYKEYAVLPLGFDWSDNMTVENTLFFMRSNDFFLCVLKSDVNTVLIMAKDEVASINGSDVMVSAFAPQYKVDELIGEV